MASYRVFVKASAAKEIEEIGAKRNRQRVVSRIKGLAHDPRPPGALRLSGRERYRIRQGRFRIVYSIEDDRLLVFVV